MLPHCNSARENCRKLYECELTDFVDGVVAQVVAAVGAAGERRCVDHDAVEVDGASSVAPRVGGHPAARIWFIVHRRRLRPPALPVPQPHESVAAI